MKIGEDVPRSPVNVCKLLEYLFRNSLENRQVYENLVQWVADADGHNMKGFDFVDKLVNILTRHLTLRDIGQAAYVSRIYVTFHETATPSAYLDHLERFLETLEFDEDVDIEDVADLGGAVD